MSDSCANLTRRVFDVGDMSIRSPRELITVIMIIHAHRIKASPTNFNFSFENKVTADLSCAIFGCSKTSNQPSVGKPVSKGPDSAYVSNGTHSIAITGRDQCFRCSRYIGKVTPKNNYLYYKKEKNWVTVSQIGFI